jgi:CBS domain-containing protein
MLPEEILVRTKIAQHPTTVRAVFDECLRAGVQALPFCDDEGKVTGRVTLKYIINRSILPAHMADLAHLIGPRLASSIDLERRMAKTFDDSVTPYVQEPHTSIESDSELMKALATMEHHDTSYLFVVDGGEYKGTLTIQGIARWMLSLAQGS